MVRGATKLSVLRPYTHLRPHNGGSNTRLRVHLGVIVPQGSHGVSEIRVGQVTKSWSNGSCMAFDDSFEHEVWHNHSLPRVALIVDVWHPEMDENSRMKLLQTDSAQYGVYLHHKARYTKGKFKSKWFNTSHDGYNAVPVASKDNVKPDIGDGGSVGGLWRM